MTELKISKGSNPKSDGTMNARAMSTWRLIILWVGIGAVVIIIALILNVLRSQLNVFLQSSELKRNQAKWGSQHIPHYKMSLDLPFNNSLLTVEVKDGKVVSVVDALGETVNSTDLKSSNDYYPNVFTIPDLFSFLGHEILNKPPTITVTYDPNLGYPTSIYIDPWTEPCCEDFTITVQDFHTLQP